MLTRCLNLFDYIMSSFTSSEINFKPSDLFKLNKYTRFNLMYKVKREKPKKLLLSEILIQIRRKENLTDTFGIIED